MEKMVNKTVIIGIIFSVLFLGVNVYSGDFSLRLSDSSVNPKIQAHLRIQTVSAETFQATYADRIDIIVLLDSVNKNEYLLIIRPSGMVITPIIKKSNWE